jgi:hypothetical protein
MPSSRRRSPRDIESLTFFVDRGLGRRQVPAVFRDAGFVVVLMGDLYPDRADQAVADDKWITEVSDRGWVALTKDVNIIRDHEPALRGSTPRVFALDNANITGDEMARRYRANLHRIVQRSRKPGPYVDVVHRDRVERRWPR